MTHPSEWSRPALEREAVDAGLAGPREVHRIPTPELREMVTAHHDAMHGRAGGGLSLPDWGDL